MKRYIFLLLAFFLMLGTAKASLGSTGFAPAVSLGAVNVASNVNSVPDVRSNTNSSVPDIRNERSAPTTINSVPDIRSNGSAPTSINSVPDVRRNANGASSSVRETSGRNATELGVVGGGSSVHGGAATTGHNQPANLPVTTAAPEAKGAKTSSNSNASCKTYEGTIYDQGQAGFSDCMKTIQNDRQGARTAP